MNKRIKKSDLFKEPIHRLITVEEFLRRVKEDPGSVWTDFDVRYAIEKLSDACLFDNEIYRGKALLTFVSYKGKLKLVSGNKALIKTFKNNPGKILEKVGLKAFILKNPKRTLDKYRHNPKRLVLEVDTLTDELRESLPRRGRKLAEIIRTMDEKSEQHFNKKLSKGAKEEILKPNASHYNTCRNFALRIVADMNHVAFRTLYNLYWNCKRSVKESAPDRSFLRGYDQSYNDYLRREHFRYEFNDVFKRFTGAVEEIVNPSGNLKNNPAES